jgi:NADH-ubiquinone oxidoreductase chain 5
LVTAGVYLFIRFYGIIFNSEMFIRVLLYLSIITIFIAGLRANFENDIKKIVALSTLSQLGLIIFVLSLGCLLFTFFHLITHALFKALLFLCVGKVIHYSGGRQDLRILGALIKGKSFTIICFHSANLALCGFPFLAGFYSKDLIIENFVRGDYNFFLIFLLRISLLLTCMYSIRLSFYIVIKNFIGFKFHIISDSNFGYNGPIFILLIGAVFSGGFLS